jgi:hypothetical protein
VRRDVPFDSPWHKAQWLDASASIDALHPAVSEHVLSVCLPFAHGASTSARTDLCVARLFAFWQEAIRYTRDIRDADGSPGEQFADAPTVLRRRYDDCDGKARGFVAALRAATRLFHLEGLEARIQPIFDLDGNFTHVQAALRFPSAPYPTQRDGWILAELTLRGVPLGYGAEKAKRDAAGRPEVTS